MRVQIQNCEAIGDAMSLCTHCIFLCIDIELSHRHSFAILEAVAPSTLSRPLPV